jgi:chondroitin synthase
MNILPVILSCKKNKHLWKNLIEKIPNCLIFCGEETLETNYKLENNILYLKCNDFYEGLPEKIIAMLNVINIDPLFLEITHIIKIDDHDTEIKASFNESLKLNRDIIKDNHYLGQRINKPYCIGYLKKCTLVVDNKWHFGKCSPHSEWKNKPYNGSYVDWLDGGCGYILSKYSINCICNMYDFNNLHKIKEYHIYEDVMIGLILHKYNVKPILIKNIFKGDK